METKISTALSAPVLGQLLLMQSVVGTLPDEPAIFSFVCRGLSDLPGVAGASHAAAGTETAEPATVRFPLRTGQSRWGELLLKVADPAAFTPYAEYLQNFCAMLAVILEERHQRRLNKQHEDQLEQRVQRRTKKLTEEIEERRKAEEQLQKSQALLHSMVEGTPDAVFIKDLQGRYLLFNNAAERLTGRPASKVLGLDDHSLFPPSEAAAVMAADRKVIEGETVQTYEEQLTNAAGEPAIFLTTKGPVYSASGNPFGVFGIHRDITERKRIETELRLQSVALTAAANGIVITDREGLIMWVNPAFSSLTGYTLAEALGKNPRDLVKSGRQTRAVYDEMWQTIRDGHVWRGEMINRRKDGSLYPEEMTITPVRDAAGEITHFIAIKQDLIERTKAEAALRASEEHFRSITLSATDAIITADAAGRICDWNPGAERMFGYMQNEARGQSLELIIPPRDRERHNAGMQRVLAGGEAHIIGKVVELTGLRRDGREFPLDLSLSVWETSAGKNFAASIRDLTERKRVENALIQSEERFRSLYENTTIGLYRTSPDGHILLANPALVRTLGYASFDELAQVNLQETGFHPAYPRREFHELIERTGEIHGLESAWRRKDGSVVFVRESARSIRDAAGMVLYYEGTAEDITERKRAEAALRHEQALFTSLITSIPDHIYFKDRLSRFVRINESMMRSSGLESITGAIGKTDFDFFTEEHARQTYESEQRLMVTGEPIISLEEKETWTDGRVTWVSTTKIPLRDAEGRITGLVGISRDITRQKQAEVDKEQERILSSSIISSLPGFFYLINAQGRFLRWNANFEKVSGYSADEIGRLHPLDLFTGEEKELIRQRIQTVFEQGAADAEAHIVSKTGTRSPYYFTGVRVCLEGQFHLVGMGMDVTERKRAEEGVRLFRALVDQSNDIVEVVDTETGRFLDVNEKGCMDLGYSREEFLALSVFDLDPMVSPAAFLKIMEGLRQTGVLMWEGSHRRKDGSTFPVEVNIKYVRLERDYAVAVVRDITRRKQAEDALRKSEERYRLMFDHNPLPMWLYDIESFRLLAVNESAVHHYGFTSEEFHGLTIWQLHPPEDVAALRKNLAHLRTEGMRTGEYRHQRKDGTIIQVEIISRPLVFDGRDARLVIAADITDKKMLEEKYLHAQRLESLGMLAAGIAHDLNNVLAPIMFVAPLLRQSFTTPRDLKILDTLERSGERGMGLVKLILGFAQSTSGEFQLTQLKHVVRDVIGLVEETFPKFIRLKHDIPTDTWPIECKPTQIHQVLLNLCVNARDAMPRGGTLHIAAANRRLGAEEAGRIPGARPGSWLTLEVSDTGTGISPELMQRIWEPFFTTKEAGKGTGLGLATVRGIVVTHHGFIELQTKVGRGTTFRVFLPAVEEDAKAAASIAPFALSEGNGELVLVVDDDQAVRDVITTMLRRHNYRVLCCNDGVEALEFFTANPGEFALVITDVDMPNLGGVGLTRMLWQLRPDLRILTISGKAQSMPEISSIPAAAKLAHAFLQKPFKFEELLLAVHRLLHPPERT
jgi:two-component system cell cycle sensor histidine kinase/response regulator CckA